MELFEPSCPIHSTADKLFIVSPEITLTLTFTSMQNHFKRNQVRAFVKLTIKGASHCSARCVAFHFLMNFLIVVRRKLCTLHARNAYRTQQEDAGIRPESFQGISIVFSI